MKFFIDMVRILIHCFLQIWIPAVLILVWTPVPVFTRMMVLSAIVQEDIKEDTAKVSIPFYLSTLVLIGCYYGADNSNWHTWE